MKCITPKQIKQNTIVCMAKHNEIDAWLLNCSTQLQLHLTQHTETKDRQTHDYMLTLQN